MNQRRTLIFIATIATTFAVTACGSDGGESPAPEGGGVATVVPDGKADNYFSTVAQEYTVTGKTWAVIDQACLDEGSEVNDPEVACKLRSIGLKNFEIAWILNQYVIDKHDSANEEWGGFTGMTRPASFEALETSEPDADGRFDYTFTSELSGPLSLLDKMDAEACTSDPAKRCFTLEVPVLDNATLAQMDTGSEWYRKAPYKEYDPSTYTGDKETLELTIEVYPRSNDAYLEYGKLFSEEHLAVAGGKLRIGIFVGWDYYDDRYDLQTAQEVYRWLTVNQGFQSPVGSYDELKIDSGELTKTIKVDGKEVEVEVQLVHPGQGDPASEAFAGEMKAAMQKAFTQRQVVVYEGHAGPLYGFALGNWRATEAGELDDSELPFLDIPPNFYQVVLASGCDTYMVADSLYSIPVKAGRVDLDVITTTSFSNAGGRGRTTKALLEAVINQSSYEDGGLEPMKYGELIRDLNNEWWMTPLYGVHGIDDNPRYDPFADRTLQCAPCAGHDECGGHGNQCVKIATGDSVCTTECRTDDDCGAGASCQQIADDDTIFTSTCIPSSCQ